LIERLLDREASSQSKGRDHPPVLIEVPVRFRRRGVEAKLVVLNQQAASEPDANLI
jgi:site-specific DNA recombinase